MFWRPLLVFALGLVLGACGESHEAAVSGASTLSETSAVNTHYGSGAPVDRAALAKLRAAGVHTLRNDLNWSAVEQQRGVYDFQSTGVDDLVQSAAAAGLRLLFILDYGNRLYGPPKAVVDDAGRAAFAAFAAAAARRYQGRGLAWEVWNEPNLGTFWNGSGAKPNPEMYALLVQAAAGAIRAVDPSATIVMGAAYTGFPELVPLIGGIPGVDFLERVFATGALDVVEAVTFHPYRAEAPESVGETVAAIRQHIAATGRNVPLWCGEWGYTTYDPDAPATNVNTLPALSLDRQAAYAARMLLNNFRLGLPLTVWYVDRDSKDPPPGDMEAHFGLMNDDLSPKPSYTALAAANRIAGDGRLVRELSLGEGRYGLELDTPRGRVTALWAVEPVSWSLQFQGDGARVLGRDGQQLTDGRLGSTRTLVVQPDDGPIYLQGNITVLGAQ